jgi:hypothetical protein
MGRFNWILRALWTLSVIVGACSGPHIAAALGYEKTLNIKPAWPRPMLSVQLHRPRDHVSWGSERQSNKLSRGDDRFRRGVLLLARR